MKRLLAALFAIALMPASHVDAGLVRPPHASLKPVDHGVSAYTGPQWVCHRTHNPLGGWRYVRYVVRVDIDRWLAWYPRDMAISDPDAVCR